GRRVRRARFGGGEGQHRTAPALPHLQDGLVAAGADPLAAVAQGLRQVVVDADRAVHLLGQDVAELAARQQVGAGGGPSGQVRVVEGGPAAPGPGVVREVDAAGDGDRLLGAGGTRVAAPRLAAGAALGTAAREVAAEPLPEQVRPVCHIPEGFVVIHLGQYSSRCPSRSRTVSACPGGKENRFATFGGDCGRL